jgi:hypothetical protein
MLRCIVLFGGGVSFFVFSLFFPLVLGWFVVLFFLRFRSLHPKVTLCNSSLSSLNEKHVFHVLKKGKAKRFLGVLRGCITRFLNHVILCYILPCLSSFFFTLLLQVRTVFLGMSGSIPGPLGRRVPSLALHRRQAEPTMIHGSRAKLHHDDD